MSQTQKAIETIKTVGPKYMGSKLRLLPHLLPIIMSDDPKHVLDAFTGTTRVAQALRGNGVHVTTVDVSHYSRVLSHAWVSGAYDLKFVENMAAKLSRLHPVVGWFTNSYCDVKGVDDKTPVRFMQPKNGMRVDAYMDELTQLHSRGLVTDIERDALVAILMLAMDRVDNTVGTQQAYLKSWCTRSHNDLYVQTYTPPLGPVGKHVTGDMLKLKLGGYDVAYIDPPYTSMNYTTNYHIWNSIALWDKPDIVLKTNRRSDAYGKIARNPWCKSETVVDCMRKTLSNIDAKSYVISYSESGLICADELRDVVSEQCDIIIDKALRVSENVMSMALRNEERVCQGSRDEMILVATPRT